VTTLRVGIQNSVQNAILLVALDIECGTSHSVVKAKKPLVAPELDFSDVAPAPIW
jgi:hypothetical protein